MKKIKIIYIVIILLVSLTGCAYNNEMKISYKDDAENEFSSNYTYKFVGQSEHFYFETGKVYYNGNERELLISNFNLKEKMDSDTKCLINLYFNDILLDGNINGKANLDENNYKKTLFGEHGYLGEKDKNGNIIGESDSFLETTKDTFKSSIKLEIIYCLKNECNTEEMKIKIMEEK